jgi:hypothetical protein
MDIEAELNGGGNFVDVLSAGAGGADVIKLKFALNDLK